jgi:aminopeptidase
MDRLGRLIAEYSLELGDGEIVRIDGTELASHHVLAVMRAALALGAHPYANVTPNGLHQLLVSEGSEDQIRFVSQIEWNEIERVDAVVTLWSDANTRAFTRADPKRHALHLATRRGVSRRLRERIAAGQARWCGTLVPTHAFAQDAGMSLSELEDFVYGALHCVDGEDPVEYWRRRERELEAIAAGLAGARELRIVGPDTDLTVGVEGRRWLTAGGRRNLPDGEVFTSPLEARTDGTIRYTLPAIHQGVEVEDVRLRFEAGRVVAFEAGRGRDHLAALLDMDEGARILGEVAFGLNYEIDRFTRNILLDEKIGGTMHLALGFGFAEAGSENVSGLHWDMICDLREDGEVHADGELVWRAGRFLEEPAVAHVG